MQWERTPPSPGDEWNKWDFSHLCFWKWKLQRRNKQRHIIILCALYLCAYCIQCLSQQHDVLHILCTVWNLWMHALVADWTINYILTCWILTYDMPLKCFRVLVGPKALLMAFIIVVVFVLSKFLLHIKISCFCNILININTT